MNSNFSSNGIVTSSCFNEGIFNLNFNNSNNFCMVEPDGSVWQRIFNHTNPLSTKFNSSDNFYNYITASGRFFWCPILNQIKNNIYEFILMQKQTSTSTLEKYRWIQYKNPYDATFGDVDADDIVKITGSGYTTPTTTYGGIYKMNQNSFFNANNGTNGNWYGAIGCWTDWNSGIPGYNDVKISTGYISLYLRIDNFKDGICTISNDKRITANEIIEI